MPGTNLTRAEAAERARDISVESYRVALDLTGGPETFTAHTTVVFTARTGADSFIDAITASVESVTLNGTSLDPAEVSDGERILLPELAEHNELVVESTMHYMNTGEGLHRFVDPADGQVYLYSQFEVADTRRMFPVFEQPDLKATFHFSVTAPAGWEVVSNQPSPAPVPVREGVARWDFSPTPVVSCYITALIAGPYLKTTDSVVSSDGRTVELGLFARRSLFEYMDASEMFEITKQGFAFYESQFGVPYPFEKYDQLFVPQFNAGAMENAGAVTFVESYIFRSKPAQALVERRAITVLHELAHMWFGDLVTMRWWNDLWLNESFAEYMSTLACAQSTKYTNAWTTFAAGEKSWGYAQDQLPTTHPIKAEIPDLEAVLVNFDGITYAKGASVLKQLVAWVGQEQFMAGLNRYFGKHAWSNTELPDLMGELEAASGRDLADWSARWLETAGVNTLVPRVSADDDGVITSFAIEQLPQEGYPTLRPHRVAVGFYDHSEATGRLTRTFQVELDVDGELTEVPQLVGRERPDLVLVNDDDLAYAKIRLDECSLDTAMTHLGDFDDSLPRSLVWAAAWDSVHDGVSPASDYVRLVLTNVGHETDSTTVQVQLRQLDVALDRYLAPEHADRLRAEAADALWDLTAAAEPGSDHQWQFFRAFLRRACTPAQLDRVAGFAAGEGVPEGVEMDTDTRWSVLTALVAAGRRGPEDVEAALREDNTETGAIAAATARAAVPTSEAKAETWRVVVEQGALPNSQQQAAIAGFFRVHDDALVAPYASRYFAEVTGVWRERTHELAQQVAVGLFPRHATQDTVDAAQRFLDQLDPELSGLRRIVLERQDAARRAVRAQQVDAAALHPSDDAPGAGR
ncbi:aminopeptidase N [Kocuria sp.]|uniref:aminopeptidase N n=1 Tax=Kocuria sp. TaxID=1871328 RepID=UPI0026DB0C51|nr:aminopeptidase N [Kocuria sp.]MDO4918455.1 aminopeptidase N [Kocuria sp.]